MSLLHDQEGEAHRGRVTRPGPPWESVAGEGHSEYKGRVYSWEAAGGRLLGTAEAATRGGGGGGSWYSAAEATGRVRRLRTLLCVCALGG